RSQFPGVDVQDRLGHGANKINVVADENQRAFVLRERADKRIDAADIEVRRRLIHQEQVRRIQQQPNEGKACLFSAAQDRRRLKNIVAAKKKGAENSPRDLFRYRIGHVPRRFQHGHFRIEHVDPILRKITDLYVVPDLTRSILHGQHSSQQLQQRRFPRAIRTDEYSPLSPLRLEIQTAIHSQLAVGVIDFLQRDDAMAAPRWLRKTEVHGLLARDRRLDLLHPVDLLEFALRLRRLTRFRSKTIGKKLERRDFLLLVLVGRELLFF